jgi:hypothetical protein
MNKIANVGFNILIPMVMKSWPMILYGIMSCTPLKVDRRFGGTHLLHLKIRLPLAFTLVFFAWFILRP